MMTTLYFALRLFAVIAGGLYILVAAFLYMNQAQFLFPGAFLAMPAELSKLGALLGLETKTIEASDGEALFLFHRAPDQGKPVVILFHGNASYPEAYGFLYANWIDAGYGIIAAAARGYPRSSGKADGEKMLTDALDIYDWGVKTYPGHPVYVVGQSLGTSPAIHLAAHRSVAGAVLISPFKSMLSLVWSKLPYFPTSLILKSPFRSDLDIARVTAPILVLHGDSDDLVPLSSAQELVGLAKSKVVLDVIAGAGHVVGLFEPDMISRIDRFIGIGEAPQAKATRDLFP